MRSSIILRRGGRHAALPAQTPGLELPHDLIRPVQLVLDGAPDAQRGDGGPDAPLAAQDPVVDRLARGRLEQPHKVARRHLGHERHGRGGDLLVDEEAADARGQQAQGVELAQPMPDLEADHAHEEGRELGRAVGGARRRRAVHVGLEEGDQVGAGLADDEVVHVEELGDAAQRGVAVVVRGVRPVVEVGRVGGRPGHDVSVDVLAEEGRLAVAVEGGRCRVGRDGCCPDQLHVCQYRPQSYIDRVGGSCRCIPHLAP